eukprot:COSAG02_NODE_2292_length_9199_cov_45.393956_8_plen_48_part_00
MDLFHVLVFEYMYVRTRRRPARARARVGPKQRLILAPLAKLELPTGE